MAVEFLESVGGTISYEDSHSEGPLVVLMPPMGSLRSVYRFLTPTLVTAGYRVVVPDLRGHGDSTTHWHTYSIRGHGLDLLALIRHVDAGPAFVVGNSFSGGVAVWAAVEAPDIVRGIALVGGLVRKVKVNPLREALTWVTFAGPWGPGAWMDYYPKMYPTRRPDDFDAHVAETKRSMKERGRFSAFRKIAAAPRELYAANAPRLERLPNVRYSRTFSTQEEYWCFIGGVDIAFSCSHHETFGIGMLEQGYAGAACVVPCRVAYPEVHAGAMVVEPSRVSESISTLLQDPALWTQVAASSRANAAKYGVERTVDTLLNTVEGAR